VKILLQCLYRKHEGNKYFALRELDTSLIRPGLGI
jgi:hypothetical protein